MLVWVRVVKTLTEQVERKPPIGQPRAIVWNDRVFTTDRQLKRYLDARGASYTRWVSKHPSAFAVLQHELPASATASRATRRTTRVATARHARSTPASDRKAEPRPATAGIPASTPAAATASRSAAAPTSTSGTGGGVSLSLLLLIALAGVGTLLVVVAVLPARLAPEFMREFYVEPERRIALFSLTLAILFVLFISLYFR